MVEIRDEESAKAWLETQDHQTQVWMAARAALRAFPGVGAERDEATLGHLAFASLRAMRISAAAAVGPAAEMKDLSSAAAAAAAAADSAVFSARSAARSARSAARSARSAARSAVFSARSAARSAAAAAFSAAAAADSAAFSADSAAPKERWSALWQIDTAPVSDFLALWQPLKARFEADPDWQFWAWWYQHLLDGTAPPKLWDLTQRIAREVTEYEWDWDNGKGPAKVAARIREFEAEWEAANGPDLAPPPEPEPVDPSNVVSLFDRAPIITPMLANMSYTVHLRVDAFERIAHMPNEPIPFFEDLKRLPAIADRIADILEKGRSASGAETALALEVGRLQAEVQRLKSDLEAARQDIEKLKKQDGWFSKASILKPSYANVVATAALLVSVGSSDKSLLDMGTKLANDVREIIEEIWPREEVLEDPKRLELPQTYDT